MEILLPCLDQYRDELQVERERQAGIKQKYGIQSLEQLIVRLDGELIDLYARRERGQNVDLVIRNKEEQKRGYEQALQELQRDIERSRNLTLSTPRFLGMAWVVPALSPMAAMASSAEIEAVGMQMAMQHERSHGYTPHDVSQENLGFDIRSVHDLTGHKRYIEVKARAGVGPVALTRNEWFKAQRFGKDYYLYVVLNAATTPQLHIIQNPAAKLQPDEQVEVRYLVSVEDITSKGIRA